MCFLVHAWSGSYLVLGVLVKGCFFPHNPSNPAVGPKTYQFLAALMGRSGLGKHRSSPLRSGRVVQSNSKGGNLPQVGWLSVIAIDGWPPQPVLSPVLLPSPVIAPMCMFVYSKRENAWIITKPWNSNHEELLSSHSVRSTVVSHPAPLSVSESFCRSWFPLTCVTTAWVTSLIIQTHADYERVTQLEQPLFCVPSFLISLPVSSPPFAVLSCLPVDINAQARKLQRNRAKGTLTLPRSSNSSFSRSLSETSLNQVNPAGYKWLLLVLRYWMHLSHIFQVFLVYFMTSFYLQLGVGDEPKRFYSTLPGPVRGRERETSNGLRKEEVGQGGGGVRHSLYQSPHLLLLQGYNRQVRTALACFFASLNDV